jgi:ribosomal protein L29
MAKMQDIQKKNEKELAAFVKEKREALRQERFATAGSKGRNVKSIREAKKDIARALTVLRARGN